MSSWASRNPLACFLSAICLVLGVIVLIAAVANRTSCAIYGYQTERETKYAAFVGCMVQVDGKWYPRNELRIQQ